MIYDRFANIDGSNTWFNGSNSTLDDFTKTQKVGATEINAMTIAGAYKLNFALPTFSYVAKTHANLTADQSQTYSVMIVNPDTNTFDSFYLSNQAQFEFFTTDFPDSQITLVAQS